VNIKNELEKYIKEVLKELDLIDVNLEFSQPEDLSHGDYTTNVALVSFANSSFSKKHQEVKSPRDLAEEIIARIKEKTKKMDVFSKIEAAGPGFINFFLSEKYLSNNIDQLLEDKEKVLNIGKTPKGKVVVEYSSPNIAKPFTVGHLRSTIIGDAVANLLKATGWEVLRDNHIGDWGSQFGKLLYAIKTWGDEKKIESADNPVKELVKLYVRFHKEAELDKALEDKAREWFKKLEDGDIEARRLWQKCIDWSFKEFDKLYKELDIEFTENSRRGYGESFFEDKMSSVIDELREKKLLKKDKGAELVYFKDDKYPPLMILKQDGATLYATRDLATDKFRLKEYGKDVKIINEVGAEQSLYFNQLFEVEKMLGWVSNAQRVHIRHGHYRFKDQKMSTRKGNVIFLEDLLSEAKAKVKTLIKTDSEVLEDKNIKEIAIGALKWNDLKRNSVQDIVFSWDDILNMQGDSGPYMQYTYARTQSILEKKGKLGFELKKDLLLKELEELDLVRYILRYFDIVEQAADNYSPNLLCSYLFVLAQKFNLFYQKHKVIGGDNEEERLKIVTVTGIILEYGLGLLGIKSLKKM